MFEQQLKIGKESINLAFPESMSAAVDLWFTVAEAQKTENNRRLQELRSTTSRAATSSPTGTRSSTGLGRTVFVG